VVFLSVVALLTGEAAYLVPAVVLGISVSFYAVGVMTWLAGLSPSVLVYDVKVLFVYLVLVGIALILHLLAASGKTVSEHANNLPPCYMAKRQLPFPSLGAGPLSVVSSRPLSINASLTKAMSSRREGSPPPLTLAYIFVRDLPAARLGRRSESRWITTGLLRSQPSRRGVSEPENGSFRSQA
jgi:hypothetical protein